jgi:hypothetical protein
VAPDATEHLTLEEHHPENTQIELNDLDEKQVTLLVENQSLPPAAQQALRKVLDQKNQVDVLEMKSARASTKLMPSPRTRRASARI